jgi:hypothetical protein
MYSISYSSAAIKIWSSANSKVWRMFHWCWDPFHYICSFSVSLTYILNNVGDKQHPCLRPFVGLMTGESIFPHLDSCFQVLIHSLYCSYIFSVNITPIQNMINLTLCSSCILTLIFSFSTNECTFYFCNFLFTTPYICFGRNLAIIRGTLLSTLHCSLSIWHYHLSVVIILLLLLL